jgi:hypothetical protein
VDERYRASTLYHVEAGSLRPGAVAEAPAETEAQQQIILPESVAAEVAAARGTTTDNARGNG